MGFFASLAKLFQGGDSPTASGRAGSEARPVAVTPSAAPTEGVDPGRVELDRAIALVHKISDLVEAGDLTGAVTLYANLKRLGDDASYYRDMRATAAETLVEGYAEAGDLTAARALYDGMAGFGEESAIRRHRIAAAAGLIEAYGKAGDAAAAQALYDTLGASTDAYDARRLARAAAHLVQAYLAAGDMAAAREVYNLPVLAESPESFNRAAAAYDFIVSALRAGDMGTAEAFFADLKKARGEHSDTLRVMGLQRLTDVYREKGDLEVLRRLDEELAGWGDTEEIRHGRLRLLYERIHAYADAGDTAQAMSLYESMEEHAALSDFADFRAMAASCLAGYCFASDPAAIERLQVGLPDPGDSDFFRGVHAGIFRKLVRAYAEKGDCQGAVRAYKAMASLGSGKEVRRDRLEAAVELVKAWGEAGDTARAAETYAGMAELGSAEDTRTSRLEAAAELVRLWCNAGEPVRAAELYAGMAELDSTDDEANYSRLEVAGELAMAWGRAGNAVQAAEVYTEMAELGSDDTSRFYCLAVASTLVEIWADAGNVAQAAAMYAAVEGFADVGEDDETREDVVEARLSALYHLIRAHLAGGDFHTARDLCRKFGTFTDPRTGEFLEDAREAIREAEAKA